MANRSNIRSLFANDPERRERFSYFLHSGCTGLFYVRNEEWLCHGWYSEPGSLVPHHVPPWCRRQGGYWIFFCHVREGIRKQGLYKSLFCEMVRSIRKARPSAEVHVDTEASNVPARRAVVACGFTQLGRIVTYRIEIPSQWRTLAALWQPDRPHPPQLAAPPL